MTGEKISHTYVANMDITYRKIRSSSLRGDGVKKVDYWIVILAGYKFKFIRVNDPRYNKSIYLNILNFITIDIHFPKTETFM